MATGLIGTTLGGRYEIQKLIGEGGMAEVYLANHPRLNRQVAVKVMHRHLSNDDQFKARFEREAQAIAQLKHPHIIQVYDFDFQEDLQQYYMVIEYVDGPTLSQSMQQSGKMFPLARAIEIIEHLADALGYAHNQHMQHRDIKPSNIMLDQGQRTVLTDFGIAKMVQDGGQRLTASGAMVGTPAYMSPEQASGIPGDYRSDLYSLGVVFYELATGKLPHKGDTPISTVLKHLNETPALPTEINPELPIGVEAVILRCLAKDPNDRYVSAKDLLADLHDLESAAKEVDATRRLAKKTLTQEEYNTLALEGRTQDATPEDFRITDTLATAPQRTNLIIGMGAVAIIALLALGAFLFSTAGSADDSTTPEVNPCLVTLEEDIFARLEPNEDQTASILVSEGTEVEFIGTTETFHLIRGGDVEGWVMQTALELPDGCEVG